MKAVVIVRYVFVGHSPNTTIDLVRNLLEHIGSMPYIGNIDILDVLIEQEDENDE